MSVSCDGLPQDRYTRLKALMERLRTDCPWDRTQTFETIAPYTIEEAYEVKDAIDQSDMAALKLELGDLLFQVLFHARIASEAGAFDLDDVADALVEKMVRRHPHVFGDTEKADWEEMKAAERTGGTLDGVALALPALMRAQKLQKRAAKVGFDWPDGDGAFDKIVEEAAELRDAAPQDRHEEAGDLLFSVVNLVRKLGLNAEAALRDANAKFTRRFDAAEARAGGSLDGLSLDAMEGHWQAVKRDET
ncbi:nucleoside triphosphate pyrophosphohydrolase [uncultured Algimonas sp.]|uniref:nucleoside triphosphate pyrophosphohydrolase n=1 Tax=uncultured Algimonas sp. TaxID=1547920 RepID=UPI0026170909|nr:nucleoside triphosphate pyrophosphohydrolase [uncultured Algimonas sp.]